MDTLYIGDIPTDYRFADFGSNYITLYNQQPYANATLPYYRVYFDYPGFYYSTGFTSFSSYNVRNFDTIKVSNDWLYRNDIDKIFLVCFIIIFMFIFCFNIITSCIKKGGVFGGLF